MLNIFVGWLVLVGWLICWLVGYEVTTCAALNCIIIFNSAYSNIFISCFVILLNNNLF